jgi:hypothetical protein
MSVGKKIVATVVVLGIIAIFGYVLLSSSQTNQHGGDEGGLASPSARTFVTLTTVGASAFITGFGFRDVISRALATRNRNRLKTAQGQKHP